jgi:hypothetical protein
MEIKEIGTKHGAAARAKLEAAAYRAQRATSRCVQYGKQVAGYVAGFAHGLVRPGNA